MEVGEKPVHRAKPVAGRDENGRGARPGPDRAILADGRAMAETGTVDFIDVQADPRTDTVAARAIFDNPERLLADGQTIRITIAQAAGPGAKFAFVWESA